MRTVALYEMLFGIITLVGGIIGYVEADSMISLAAGIVLGLMLVFAALSMQKGSKPALYVNLIITLAILGQFGRKYFFGDSAFMPAGLMSILGIISLLLLTILLLQPTERKRIF